MKYSILGFDQQKVCSIKKIDKTNRAIQLDIVDLIILVDIADFMNRKRIIKYTINDKIYFSITYNAIIEDLPILDIKKQALRDRLDKLCLLGLLEKEVVKNETGSWTAFRLTDLYEWLKYDTSRAGQNEEGVCSQLHRGVYSTTHGGCVVDYTPNNTTTINPNTTTINKEETKLSKLNLSKKLDFSRIAPQFMPIVEEWLQYKKEKNQPYKQKGLTAFYNRLMELSGGDVDIAKQIISQSMASNYAGIFPLKATTSNNGTTTRNKSLPIGMILQGDRDIVLEESKKDLW